MITDRRDQLASLVAQAASVTDHFYKLSQQNALPEAEAKQKALEAIAAMRHGADGYISINDSKPVIVMHPIKSEPTARTCRISPIRTASTCSSRS